MEVKIKYDKLKTLLKAMSKKARVKVGLLANQGGSDSISENLDLAGLGAVHEFGADIKITPKMAAFLHFKAEELGLNENNENKGDGYVHIPARSFLMDTFADKKAMERLLYAGYISGDTDFDQAIFEYKLLDNPDFIKDMCVMIGAKAVEMIQESFMTRGWGKWAPDSPMTIAAKGSEMPLVDTGRLRSSITYEVEG